MKMKKTKLLIPAIGMLVFTSAASVSGTVAWFTANRAITLTAGDFAVVSTASSLDVTLTAGAGTTKPTDTSIAQKTNYKLTDASFDHTDTTLPIIAPDENGANVDAKTPVATYSDVSDASAITASETALVRDSTAHIYTAFTWNIKFTISFAASATKNIGLFLDLSHAETWCHESYVANGNEAISGWYTNPGLTTAATGDHLTNGTTYYKAAPDDTGKGFRIAFVPIAMESSGSVNTSTGYAKVWAPHQTWNSDNATSKTKFVDGVALTQPLAATNFSNNTVSKAGEAAYAAATAGAAASSQKVVMANTSTNANPATKTRAFALDNNDNYLGFFGVDAGHNVSMTFTCIAYYEGTDENITSDSQTIYETVTTSMHFEAVDLD